MPACPIRTPSSSTRCVSRSPCAAGTSSPTRAATAAPGAAAGSIGEFGPTEGDLEVGYVSDGNITAPEGARGGTPAGGRANQFRRDANGDLHHLDPCAQAIIPEGHTIVSYSCGGGGYGAPTERPAEQVATDVRERWVSAETARETYRVALDDAGALDAATTERLRNG